MMQWPGDDPGFPVWKTSVLIQRRRQLRNFHLHYFTASKGNSVSEGSYEAKFN